MVQVQSTTKDGHPYTVELLPHRDERGTTCRDCFKAIRFAKTRSGKNVAISKDEVNDVWRVHFSVCSNAKPRV